MPPRISPVTGSTNILCPPGRRQPKLPVYRLCAGRREVSSAGWAAGGGRVGAGEDRTEYPLELRTEYRPASCSHKEGSPTFPSPLSFGVCPRRPAPCVLRRASPPPPPEDTPSMCVLPPPFRFVPPH